MALKNKEYVQLIKAWDKTTGLPKTGDAANITVNLIQNGTRAAASGTVAEVDSTNCPGDYKITITAAERNYDSFGINVKSSTANILCRTSGELTADIALSTGTKGTDNAFDALTAIKGTDFDTATDSLKKIKDKLNELLIQTGIPKGYSPTGETITIGTSESGTLSSLSSHDGTYRVIGEVAATGLQYRLDLDASPVGEIPQLCRVDGRYEGVSQHSIGIWAWNYALPVPALERKATMVNRTTDFSYEFPMGIENQDPVTGAMRIEFIHDVSTYNNSHRLYLDYVKFEKVDGNSQIAADLAAIAGQTGQMEFVLGKIKAVTGAGAAIMPSGELVNLHGDYDAAKTAASQTSVNTIYDLIKANASGDVAAMKTILDALYGMTESV